MLVPKENKIFDTWMLIYCSTVAFMLVAILGMAAAASFFTFWPYDLSLSLNSMYLFLNAMTTISAVVFLYSPDTTLASVAVSNMDDAGDIAPAAAMGMMIVYTAIFARVLHALIANLIIKHTQRWRQR